MVTAALALSEALLVVAGRDRLVMFASRERPVGLEAAEAEFVLSPHRHEVANKLRWLPRVETEAALDAILYPYWPPPPRRRANAPPAATYVHDLAFRLRPGEVPWQQRLYLGTVLPRALQGAAAVVVPSQATRDDLLACYPVPDLAERVHVVGEGPTPLPAAGSLPDGLEPGFVLAVGTVEARKNYDRLAAAHSRIAGAPPLVIAGRPGWNGARPPHGERVMVLGHVSDAELAALYANAGVLAFPSLYEGFGLPLLDAMAAGVPALVSDRGALPEVAGDAALVVPAEDVAAIEAGLSRLLGDAALRARLAAAGRRRAARFRWESAAAAVLGILRKIAQ